MPEIIHIAETASTNLYMRECLQHARLEEGSVVWADFQTAGRGQPGNTWESEAGTNLMFSIVIYPDCISAGEQFLISQIAALSVKRTLDTYIDDVSVKWPNDIYWKDKKICGMLIENDLSGKNIYSSVLGIGLNLNQTIFRSHAPNPVSLAQITGKTYDPETELHAFLRIFYDYYLLLLKGETSRIRAEYKDALYRKDGFFPYEDGGGLFDAAIQDIEPTGHLILRRRNGEIMRYAFKEVRCVMDTLKL